MLGKVVCENCGLPIDGKPWKTFLGFQKYTCPSCNKNTLYPLTRTYRVIYWCCFAVGCIAFLSYVSQGEIPVPGLLGVATAVALVRDYQLRKKLQLDVNKASSV